MDKAQQLSSFTTRELVDELKRRIAELDEAGVLLAGSATAPAKNLAVSRAKAEYWKGWHEYRAAHPAASVSDWRKSQKSQRRTK